MASVCTEPHVEKITCPNCKNESTLSTVIIAIPEQQKQVLNTFECAKCHIKDVSILPYIDKDERGGVRIDCRFHLRDVPSDVQENRDFKEDITDYDLRKNETISDPRLIDLSRYILLAPRAQIIFEKEDFTYTYISGKDLYTCLELLIRNIMDEIKNVYDLKLSDKTLYNPKDDESIISEVTPTENESLEAPRPLASITTLEEKQNAMSAIFAFDAFLRELDFKMTIIDDTGFSRVFPLNCKNKEKVDFFKLGHDVDVVHTWFERELE
ncbi:C4-type Zn-finger protein [Pseudoloma neurophilia]|uniref:C4-type Zn-finger protein n=1 Tax=Pseudoloma neurophilia TaxID=146866 RepID=A0A0R0M0Q5_9MICR|nr:C4-type Zn-finger protein [Pseudoloma neurophilia]